MHERVHEERSEIHDGMRIVRGMSLKSEKLGLSGKADAVEFHKSIPFPVEYKHGKPKDNDCDKVQLCAQAICLEEMLEANITSGAIFYGKTRRRFSVDFTKELRQKTEDTARLLHEFIKAGKTPPAEYSKRCESCSLNSICMPKLINKKQSVEDYLRDSIRNEEAA